MFAQPDHAAARELSADTYEQLGYGTWRSWYPSGTTELRHGCFDTATETTAPDVIAQLSPTMLFDAIAIQIDGPRARNEDLTIDVVLTDLDQRYRLHLTNGAPAYSAHRQAREADATLTTTSRAPAGRDRAFSQSAQLIGRSSVIGLGTGIRARVVDARR